MTSYPDLLDSSTLFLSAAGLVGLLVVNKLYRRLVHIRSLSFLPGPEPVSSLWGDSIDLRRAPVGSRYPEWRKRHGTTYIIREPLMVSHLF